MASNGNNARFTIATKLINQVTSEDFGLKLAMIDITSKTSAGNKEVMPGLKERTASAEIIFETKPGSPTDWYFKDAIDACREDWDYILMDCPPTLGRLTVNAFMAADAILAPVQCQYFALEGLRDLSEVVKQVRQALNPNLEISLFKSKLRMIQPKQEHYILRTRYKCKRIS